MSFLSFFSDYLYIKMTSNTFIMVQHTNYFSTSFNITKIHNNKFEQNDTNSCATNKSSPWNQITYETNHRIISNIFEFVN